jgi:hypothetical protein
MDGAAPECKSPVEPLSNPLPTPRRTPAIAQARALI